MDVHSSSWNWFRETQTLPSVFTKYMLILFVNDMAPYGQLEGFCVYIILVLAKEDRFTLYSTLYSWNDSWKLQFDTEPVPHLTFHPQISNFALEVFHLECLYVYEIAPNKPLVHLFSRQHMLCYLRSNTVGIESLSTPGKTLLNEPVH